MHRTTRALLILALFAALAPLLASAAPPIDQDGKGWCRGCLTFAPDEGHGGAPLTERNHTQYSSVWLSSIGSVQWYPDFYVSAGGQHGIQQTGVPDNKRCLHRIYHRATGVRIASVWLWGNDHNYAASYFTIGNNSSTSQAFEHSVTGCTGQVQVYYWH